MHVPECYSVADASLLRKLMSMHALALLVTTGPDAPLATHVPVISQGREEDELVGSVVLGHMNRMNPHWRALPSQARALLVFQGPQGYVSPTVYRTSPAAPTWNFAAVHLRGAISPIDDRAETLRIIKRTVQTYERDLGTNWNMRPSLGYFDQLLPGVGAFHMAIESAEAMFKLSQEQPPEVRRRVVRAFADSESGSHQQLASLMECVAFDEGVPDGSACS